MKFEWDNDKNQSNITKHNVDFTTAKQAFSDPECVFRMDVTHSTEAELRFFCFGQVDGKIMTVRYTIRDTTVRIFGAGYWRKGKEIYEQDNQKKE